MHIAKLVCMWNSFHNDVTQQAKQPSLMTVQHLLLHQQVSVLLKDMQHGTKTQGKQKDSAKAGPGWWHRPVIPATQQAETTWATEEVTSQPGKLTETVSK